MKSAREVLSDNLSNLLKSRDVDQKELAEEVGVSEMAVSHWVNGTKYPRIDKIQKMADFFGVLKSDITEEKSSSELSSTVFDSLKIPLFGSIAAGALAVVDGVTVESIDYITISKKILGKYANSSDMFAMQVNGESMNKIIKNGEIVIAKQQDLKDYHDGDIVIFSHQNEYSLKRFAPNDLEGFILFKSESHDMNFKDIPIPKDTDQDLKIYGKVVFCGSTF